MGQSIFDSNDPSDSTSLAERMSAPEPETSEVTDYLSMINADDANKANIKSMNQFANERYLVSVFLNEPLPITTSSPASNEADDITPLTLAITAWQYDYINDTSGKYTKGKGVITAVTGKYKDSLVAMTENGYDPKGKKQDWASKDHDDARAVLDSEKEFKDAVSSDDSEDAKRQAIVDLASSQQGTVVSADRGDGCKIGWERIARFYEIAEEEFNGIDQFKRSRDEDGVPTDVPKSKLISKDKIVGIKAANKFANDKNGDWSWCGIFTVWAIRTITGNGSWNKGPQGYGILLTDLQNAKKGDIVNIKISVNKNNHHILLAEDLSEETAATDVLDMVEGNIDLQGIKASHRWKLSDINGYYKTL